MRRVVSLITAAVVMAFAPLGASADVPLSIVMDGKPVVLHGTAALEHRGKTYILAAQAVRVFNGLMSFGRDGWARIEIGGRTMSFSPGRSYATMEGKRVALPAQPFELNGDLYVPLATIAKLAGASLAVDDNARVATLTKGAATFATASPAPTLAPITSDDEPSPLQALKFAATATSDASGLHAHLTITNTLDKAYKLNFPTSRQFALVLFENGTDVWDSLATATAGKPSTWTLAPHGTQTIDQDWDGFNKLAAGRFLLRVRLMTAPPLDTSPISLDIEPATR
jgi:hypothetical protein